jgi:phenylacetate-coenzyme A ligase PaaK-like adenylate-forming protein
MQVSKSFLEKIENLDSTQFEKLAFEIFQYQAANNSVYQRYLKARKIHPDQIDRLENIPFLPISFFKDHPVVCRELDAYEGYYSSSGTTGMITSKHYYWSEKWYLGHALRVFEQTYGKIQDYHVLALLPAYLERPGSSLVSMAKHFIEKSQSPFSGFYLYNQDDLLERLGQLRGDSKKVLLLGVTFALLDLAESGKSFTPMENLIVMETGGMKGRRNEMIREEVHDALKKYFGIETVHSEYGMTELLSQAYSKGEGKFSLPNTMKILLRDVNDPLSWSKRSQGGINVIDLANFETCSFIETQDLGKVGEDGLFEVLGRFDNSEVRGCNLLVQ